MSVQPDDYTYVNFPSLQVAYEDLLKIVTRLDEVTDALYTGIANDLKGVWEGAAEEYFDQKKAEWNEIEKEMGRQLFQAAAAVDVAKGNYETAERRNVALWMD